MAVLVVGVAVVNPIDKRRHNTLRITDTVERHSINSPRAGFTLEMRLMAAH